MSVASVLSQVREWMVGIGTLSLALVAAWGILDSRRDRRTEYARLVFVGSAKFVFSQTGVRDLKAIVWNRSIAPIYDVSVHLHGWDWKADPGVLQGRLFSVILPQGEGGPVPFSPEMLPPPPGRGYFRPPFSVEFSDAEGRPWTRWPDDRLERKKT